MTNIHHIYVMGATQHKTDLRLTWDTDRLVRRVSINDGLKAKMERDDAVSNFVWTCVRVFIACDNHTAKVPLPKEIAPFIGVDKIYLIREDHDVIRVAI